MRQSLSDNGMVSSTLLVVALGAFACSLLFLQASRLLVTHARLAATADLAAVAVAESMGADTRCDLAQPIVQRSSATLADCSWDELQVRVEVRSAHFAWLTAHAWAGVTLP